MPFNPLEKKFEDFAQLPDQECALIIKDYFLEALKNDIYIDWELVAKFINTPYGGREALCQLFNSAIKKNNQQIGNFTISEWIRKYQDQYLNKERNPNTFFEYVSNNPEIKKLSKSEQFLIARTLRIYDYLLVIPIVDLEGPTASILKFALRSDTPPEELSAQAKSSFMEKFRPQEIITEHLILSEALRIHPEIGEQLITSSKINLRSFPYPVRPSVKNWLADYTSNLGYAKHGFYGPLPDLFQGANAKKLSAPERNRLAYLLKAFDENSPIAVNKNMRQIIFPAHNALPASNASRSNADWRSETGEPATNPADKPTITPAGKQAGDIASAAHTNRPTNIINPPKALSDQYRPVSSLQMDQKNINSMQFSYPQKMPYEKNLSAPAPTKILPPDISAKQDSWKLSDKKTPIPPVPAKTLPQETAIKSSPWRLPAEKTFTPATPTKNLPKNTQLNSNPWKITAKSTPPQNPPKNVVDLKNINP